jgi:hypothetical protein
VAETPVIVDQLARYASKSAPSLSAKVTSTVPSPFTVAIAPRRRK